MCERNGADFLWAPSSPRLICMCEFLISITLLRTEEMLWEARAQGLPACLSVFGNQFLFSVLWVSVYSGRSRGDGSALLYAVVTGVTVPCGICSQPELSLTRDCLVSYGFLLGLFMFLAKALLCFITARLVFWGGILPMFSFTSFANSYC